MEFIIKLSKVNVFEVGDALSLGQISSFWSLSHPVLGLGVVLEYLLLCVSVTWCYDAMVLTEFMLSLSRCLCVYLYCGLSFSSLELLHSLRLILLSVVRVV